VLKTTRPFAGSRRPGVTTHLLLRAERRPSSSTSHTWLLLNVSPDGRDADHELRRSPDCFRALGKLREESNEDSYRILKFCFCLCLALRSSLVGDSLPASSRGDLVYRQSS
jgi:hypothetical protein